MNHRSRYLWAGIAVAGICLFFGAGAASALQCQFSTCPAHEDLFLCSDSAIPCDGPNEECVYQGDEYCFVGGQSIYCGPQYLCQSTYHYGEAYYYSYGYGQAYYYAYGQAYYYSYGYGQAYYYAQASYIQPPHSPSNVSVTEPDYCISGPAIFSSWTYSDPQGSPQSAYQVQVSRNAEFTQIDADSGKVMSGSTSWFSGQGLLQFNTVYRARVRVWNTYDLMSDWQLATTCNGPGCTGGSGNWKTPDYPYPQTDFTWEAGGIQENPSPPVNEPVQFTDQTVFGGGNPNQRSWDWSFGDGTFSSQQHPVKTYNAEGTYYVTLTATDAANQSCPMTRGPLFIQKPIPIWIEVAPQ